MHLKENSSDTSLTFYLQPICQQGINGASPSVASLASNHSKPNVFPFVSLFTTHVEACNTFQLKPNLDSQQLA